MTAPRAARPRDATPHDERPPFARALQRHRARRGWSQLHLALLAGVSPRHLSFLETGRAAPSREMALRLGAQLGLTLRAQNELLADAGFAPAHPQGALDAPALDAVRAAARRVLDAHEPFPAMVIDRARCVVMQNRAAERLLAPVAPSLRAPPVNVYRVLLHPDGLAPRIVNFADHARHLVARLRRDADTSHDAALDALLDEVCAWPAVRDSLRAAPAPTEHVALTLRVRDGDHALAFITTSATFGTPFDITVAELVIESLIPADAATAARLRDLARDA